MVLYAAYTSMMWRLGGLYSDVGNILCPDVNLLKWKVFEYSYIFDYFLMKEKQEVINFFTKLYQNIIPYYIKLSFKAEYVYMS